MPWKEVAPAHVVSLARAQSLFRAPQCRLFAVRYQDLLDRAGGHIPQKDGLDLTGLAPLLPDMALVTVIRPDRCVIRLAGERLKQRLGFNPVRRNYLDLVPAWRRPSAMQAMCSVVDGPAGFRAELSYRYSDGVVRETETLALPLAASRRDVDGYVLLIDRAVSGEDLASPPVGQVREATLRRRHLIDLGFGLDRSFVDRMPLAQDGIPAGAPNL